MPIDSIAYFNLYRSAASENGPWTTIAVLDDQTVTAVDPFTVPPKTPGLSDVTVRVADVSWVSVDQYVNVALAGLFKVVGKDTVNSSLALRYLDETYNTRSGNVIPVGSQVLPGSFTDSAIPSPALWYLLEGKTANGITITYNVVSVTGTPVGSGDYRFAVKIGGNSSCLARTYSVAVAPSGKMVVVGDFTSTCDFGGVTKTAADSNYDIFVAQYNSNGTLDWVNSYSSSFGPDAATGVAVGSDGSIYFTGICEQTINFGGGDLIAPFGVRSIFLVKLNSSGVHQWSKRFGNEPNTDQRGTCVAVDSAGNVLLGGMFVKTVDFGGGTITSATFGAPNPFVAKYNSAGVHQWSHAYGTNDTARLKGIAVDSSNNVFFCGGYFTQITFGSQTFTAPGLDGYLVKLNSAGVIQWARAGNTNQSCEFYSCAVDPQNNVVITGTNLGTGDLGGGALPTTQSGGIILAKYTNVNGFVFARKFGGTHFNSHCTGRAVAIDTNSNIFMIAGVSGSIQLDPPDGEAFYGPGGDIIIGKYTALGAFIWGKRINDTGPGTPTSGAFNSITNPQLIIVGGQFSQDCDFGGGLLTSPSQFNGYIAAYIA